MATRFFAPIKIRHTGTTAAGEPVWAMRLKDDSSRYVQITRVYIVASFDGTAAATTSAWVLERYDTATMTGGVAITPSGYSSSVPATHVTDVRDILAGTGLTDTSVVNLEELAIIGCPRGATGGSVLWDIKDLCTLRNAHGAKNGEGLSVTLDDTAVIGDGLRGFIEWTEHEAGT